jgi:hypothetical protein
MRVIKYLLLAVGFSMALNIDTIQVNRWYPVDMPTQYRGWGNLQQDGKNLVFYSGVSGPASHGTYCIYSNALYRFDLRTQSGGVTKQSNYYCQTDVSQPTALAENASDPTPKDRHVYNQFAYAPADSAVYLLHGASNSGNHPHDFWRYSFPLGRWEYLGQAPGPVDGWDLGGELNLIYADGELWFFLNARDIWVWNIAARTWTNKLIGTDRYAVYPIGPRGLYDTKRHRFAFYGANWTDNSSQWSDQMAFFSKDSLKWSTRTGPVKTQYAALEYNTKWDRYMLAKGSGNDSVRIFDPTAAVWSTAPIAGSLFNGYQYVEFVYSPALDLVINEKEGHFYLMRYRPPLTGQRRTAAVSRSLNFNINKVAP